METCAFVGASDFNEAHFAQQAEAGAYDAVIAVDGGYEALRRIGITPSVAIGDFDSLGYVPDDVPVQRFDPCKAASDMELALAYACEQGARRVEVYGALGGRLDHTVANIQLLARFSEQGMEASAIGLDQRVAFVTGPAVYELPLLDSGTVSVFALNDQVDGLLEEGMRYAFDSPQLANRSTRGLSNELIGRPARVHIAQGTLIVFCPLV